MEKKTLTTYEAAAVLGVSRPTLFKLIQTEGFPAIRIGRAIRVPAEALDRWMEDHVGKKVL